MKRVLAFASALALAVGAFAPAAFASDLSAVPVPDDNLSIWDSGSTDINNPYNVDDLFNYCQGFWGDLFDDGRFNNQTVSDYQRDLVGLAVSKFVSTHPDEEVNGVMTSYFDDIVDYVCSNPSDFDIFWTPDGIVSALTGNPYLNLQFGEDFYNNLYDYIIANYYTIPSLSGAVVIGSGNWVSIPVGSYVDLSTAQGGWQYNRLSASGADLWATNVLIGTNNYLVVCSYSSGGVLKSVYHRGSGSGNTNGSVSVNLAYSDLGYYQSVNGGGVSNFLISGSRGYPSGWTTSQIVADFFGNPPSNSSDPISNGKVYIRDTPIGGDNLTVSFPALPVSNSKSVSNYYYDSYGDTWEDNSTVINNTAYNNNTTTVYPITYDNNIPLWLVSPTTSITTYNYSLDLPSADLEELPSEFEGGGVFFQDSFLALGGFGSFVLIAFSFGLVALFFKG